VTDAVLRCVDALRVRSNECSGGDGSRNTLVRRGEVCDVWIIYAIVFASSPFQRLVLACLSRVRSRPLSGCNSSKGCIFIGCIERKPALKGVEPLERAYLT
jgi:hypothetical protein